MEIFVYECFLSEISKFMRTLFVDNSKGFEHFSFEFAQDWLNENTLKKQLDPNIYYYNGRQFPKKNEFGFFLDSCPNRWGKNLIKRYEKINAKEENRNPKKLLTSDYLLSIFDKTRMGALRFKLSKDEDFLSNNKNIEIPPWIALKNLEETSRNFETDDDFLDDKWLKQLISAGSSLGGARPKANVKNTDGSLWIAKFPSKHDEWDIGAWEKVVHDLAKLCNLNVPESKLEKFSNLGSTFLVKRFDRDIKKRLHFASAMTLLGKTDGANAYDGSGYLEIAQFIKDQCVNPKEDLEELWMRIVFSMVVNNTDDHFRNHGFILTKDGWQLSPLFDVNPTPFGNELSLNINSNDNRISLDLAIESAHFYGISKEQALKIAKEIINIVDSNWENLAKKYNISHGSIEYMRPAFSLK